MKVNKDVTYEVEGYDMFDLEAIDKKRLEVIDKIILREVTMEKPRKKEHDKNCWINKTNNKYPCDCGAEENNSAIDAMYAWIEGEMPTVEDIKKIIYDKAENYIEDDSGCDELRNEQAKDIHSLITRKLKGEG